MKVVDFLRQCGDVLLSTHTARRTSVAMALLGLLLMTASAGVIIFLDEVGVIQSGGFARWWATASVGGMVVMTGLIRSGLSERCPDPALTVSQMVWTITSGAVAYAFAGEARGVVPSVLAMILFFGILGLNQGQVIALGVFAMLAFSTAVLASTQWGDFPLGFLDIAYLLMILIVMGGTMALNLRILSVKRARQQLRKESLSLALEVAKNREIALRDGLTGLLNRRAMMEIIGQEQRRNHRTKASSVLAMLDLDHFKRINDNYGHAAGDGVLQAFAATAASLVREGDVLARWGGDEFLLMLSDTTVAQAAMLIKRMSAGVAQLEVSAIPGPLGLKLSAGLALMLPGESAEDTIHRADQAMYQAKAQGRNRVALADQQADSGSPGLAQPEANEPQEHQNASWYFQI